MQEFAIQPLTGVGPVRFGMTVAEVETHLGQGRVVSQKRHLYLECLFVDFDAQGRAEFIEAAESSRVAITLDGQNLHALKADAAVETVSRLAPYDPNDPELGYSFVFPALQVALWRSTVERERFESVAAGKAGYFSEGG